MSFWRNVVRWVDPVQGGINATSNHPSQQAPPSQINPNTGGNTGTGIIDPTIDPSGDALTPEQLNQLYGNSAWSGGVSNYRLPSSHAQDFTQWGYPAMGLNTDKSNLYNALMDYYRNTPESVKGDMTDIAKRAGTYGDTSQFESNLNASSKAATDARAKILEQRINPLYESAGLTAPGGGHLTREQAHQYLINLATQHNAAGNLVQGVPTTFAEGPMAATGWHGFQGTDYTTQLQSLLAAYANLPNVDSSAAAAMGGNRVQTQQSRSALDQLQQYQLQQQANQLRNRLGLPQSPAGSI